MDTDETQIVSRWECPAWFREINGRLGWEAQHAAEWKALQALRDGTWMDPEQYEKTVRALER